MAAAAPQFGPARVALKHEGTDLRMLSRLFKQDIAQELTAYINANRFGVYTRRAWFLYERMTSRRLAVEEPYGVQNVPAIDPTQYHARTPTRSPRRKIDDNLPGVPGFRPLIRRTERLAPDRTAALAADARSAVSGADPAELRRAVGFMLLNESRGSFGIEGETPPRNRLERWGRIIAEARNTKLSISGLEDPQRSLFDPKQAFLAYGLRRAGGFVGRHGGRDQAPVPDHVSARPQDLPILLANLLQTYALLKTHQLDPVLTAAVLGFGFVFIHPFEDGNGRLHRFLLQEALADTGFNPEGVVLPVSAAILGDLLGYRAALEDYSASTLPFIEWEPTPDGNVHVTNDTAHLCRYFDATRQAEYLADCIERTVRIALPAEVQFLHRFDDAKRRIAELADMPDRLASLFIGISNGCRVVRDIQDRFVCLLIGPVRWKVALPRSVPTRPMPAGLSVFIQEVSAPPIRQPGLARLARLRSRRILLVLRRRLLNNRRSALCNAGTGRTGVPIKPTKRSQHTQGKRRRKKAVGCARLFNARLALTRPAIIRRLATPPPPPLPPPAPPPPPSPPPPAPGTAGPACAPSPSPAAPPPGRSCRPPPAPRPRPPPRPPRCCPAAPRFPPRAPHAPRPASPTAAPAPPRPAPPPPAPPPGAAPLPPPPAPTAPPTPTS